MAAMVGGAHMVSAQSGGSTMNGTPGENGRSARRLLVSAAVLEATAGALGLAGLVVCTVAVTALTRRRVANMDVPPSELARRQWAKARAATSAGMGAWRSMPLSSSANGVRERREAARL
jgi:hypothetical protein